VAGNDDVSHWSPLFEPVLFVSHTTSIYEKLRPFSQVLPLASCAGPIHLPLRYMISGNTHTMSLDVPFPRNSRGPHACWPRTNYATFRLHSSAFVHWERNWQKPCMRPWPTHKALSRPHCWYWSFLYAIRSLPWDPVIIPKLLWELNSFFESASLT
jgi:hypothetical protein